MTTTYRSMQADEPGGAPHLVEVEIPEPDAGEVRVIIEAAGICHSDSTSINGFMPGVTFPPVTGHEIAGRIDTMGEGVAGFELGKRVAVGWFGGNCGSCVACREGDAINCVRLQTPGLSYPGGLPMPSSCRRRPWHAFLMHSRRPRQRRWAAPGSARSTRLGAVRRARATWLPSSDSVGWATSGCSSLPRSASCP